MALPYQRLGVNIDHVATLRNARGGVHPCPVEAAICSAQAGADGITAHLREDRRHIRDDDMVRIKQEADAPLNFEMAATDEMLRIALDVKPNACCLVPEKREELTTEGGLDVISKNGYISKLAVKLQKKEIRVSLFIDADEKQIKASQDVGADIIELHTGRYADATTDNEKHAELTRITQSAAYAHSLGLEVHAGHGLRYDNVTAIAAIPEIVELNIGYFIIGQSVFDGLKPVVTEFKRLMKAAR